MPCSRNSLDVAKEWADKPGSDFREGSSAQLGICSRPDWGSTYGGKYAKRPPWKWWILWWIFAVDFLVAKYKRKIRRKNQPENPPAENKNIRRRTTPPKSASQTQKSAAKPANKSTCQTSKYTPGFFSIEKDYSCTRLQSMDSGTLFGCLLGIVEAPMLKCTCNPSAAAGGTDKVCCSPFQTTLLVKSVRLEKPTQK